MTLVRGEYTRSYWKTESASGEESVSGTWQNFGVVSVANCPDPEYQYDPLYVIGEGRKWYHSLGNVKEVYSGSMSDIIMQDGRFLKFVLGSLVTSGSSPLYTHTIETGAGYTIPSFTWEVNDRYEDGSIALVRRYLGCKVNRATLAISQGRWLSLNLDNILAQNIKHNDDSVLFDYKYEGGQVANTTTTIASRQPYMFHEGKLILFGIEFASVSDIRIEIMNNLEPEYYVQTQYIDPYPAHIPAGRLAITCRVTVEITDLSLFRALMAKGRYGANADTYTGFTGYLEFKKAESESDKIRIYLGPRTGVTSVSNQGCFVRSAQMNKVESPHIPVSMIIEVPEVSFVVTDDLSSSDYA